MSGRTENRSIPNGKRLYYVCLNCPPLVSVCVPNAPQMHRERNEHGTEDCRAVVVLLPEMREENPPVRPHRQLQRRVHPMSGV